MKVHTKIVITLLVFIGIIIWGYITYRADFDKKNIEDIYSADCVVLYDKNADHSTLQYYTDSISEIYSHNKFVSMQETDVKKQLKEIQIYIEYGVNVVVSDDCFEEAIYWAQAYYPDVNFILLNSVPSCKGDYVLRENCISICDKSRVNLNDISKMESVTVDEFNEDEEDVLLGQLLKCKKGEFTGSKLCLCNH